MHGIILHASVSVHLLNSMCDIWIAFSHCDLNFQPTPNLFDCFVRYFKSQRKQLLMAKQYIIEVPVYKITEEFLVSLGKSSRSSLLNG